MDGRCLDGPMRRTREFPLSVPGKLKRLSTLIRKLQQFDGGERALARNQRDRTIADDVEKVVDQRPGKVRVRLDRKSGV